MSAVEGRRRIIAGGIVQGVGFRPFVYNLAHGLGLSGSVANTSDGVVIEVQGPVTRLDEFAARLDAELPPLARLDSVSTSDVPVTPGDDFTIAPSLNTPGTATLIPPDVAVCADCRREVRDRADRRCGYPFTNCTNCGPRWTIIGSIPYDRPFTSMARFTMCATCQAEYDDPGDRRFHAQPNACPQCGPRLWLKGPMGATDHTGGVLGQTAEALARHAIMAIKGLGGFHLATRADVSPPVAELRRRKGRAAKPLALMVADLETARGLADLTPAEEALLGSPQAPIVLVERRADAPVAAEVAPGHRRLGLMLPPTPMHLLLFDALRSLDITALVMTSGNASDEPICIENDEARRRLGDIADGFLLHDRDILRRADDSVVQVVDERPLILRRSRGYAPVPVLVPAYRDAEPVLAVGPELKNTICLFKDGSAFVSPHIGDLETLEAGLFFAETITTLQNVLECEPRVIAHDLHPEYAATKWAREQDECRLVGVQHHHAHLVAVQAEHGLVGPTVGLIMDGTGYGPDGTIWGGEILVGDARGFSRAGHFEPVPLPGGDAAIRAPWRQAVSYLRQAYGEEFFVDHPEEFGFQHDRPVAAVLEMLAREVNSPLTSSCGRLFDAVAAMVGPWTEASYEAQAAIELMALTDDRAVGWGSPFAAVLEALEEAMAQAGAEGTLLLPVRAVVRAVRESRRAGVEAPVISAMFHRTLIEVLAQAGVWAARRHDLQDVVLGGGVFQNEILLAGVETWLRNAGLRVWRPELVPPGDGGVSLGQAVVAAATG